MQFSHNGRTLRVMEDVCLRSNSSEFLAVVGRSGCGKTTLLRLLAGSIAPTSGKVKWHSEAQDGPGGALLVRQEHSLFPWKTALENAAFGLEMQGVDRELREARAHAMFQRFGLAGAERVYPRELSLGMKQRIAVIRAFLSAPALLLLDEPFAALDVPSRLMLQQELLAVWSEAESLGAIFVTHDVEEAILLSDRVLLLGGSPASIREEWRVELPRPRHAALTLEPHFIELKSQLLAALGVDVGAGQRA